MKIKRFEAATMAEALRMVKKAFGEEAVILSAKTTGKAGRIFGARRKGQVVVTAAIDHAAVVDSAAVGVDASGQAEIFARSTPAETGAKTAEGIGHFLHRYSPITRTGQQKLKPKFVRLMSAGKNPQAEDDRPETGPSLYERLRANGLGRDLAAELAEQAEGLGASESEDENEPIAALAPIIEARGWVAPVRPPAKRSPHVVVLVGPDGVGKTATAAKILGRAIMQGMKRLGVISLDDRRIAGTVELERFSALMGLRLVTARDADQLSAALEQMNDTRLVVVDTPGLGPQNEDHRHGLCDMIRRMDDPEVHLLLNATARERELAGMIAFFRPLGLTRVLPTHVDWCGQLGPFINQLDQCRLPASYMAAGTAVPEGLRIVTAQDMAAMLLSNTLPENNGQARPDSVTAIRHRAAISPDGSYVANRNSDIFHDHTCNAVKRINDDNILIFRDAADAMEQGFKPCRMCCIDLLVPKPLNRPVQRQYAGIRN